MSFWILSIYVYIIFLENGIQVDIKFYTNCNQGRSNSLAFEEKQ